MKRHFWMGFLTWLLMGWPAGICAQVWFDVKLWEQGLPNSNGRDGRPEDQTAGIYAPEMRVFLPDSSKATGRMVLACPGGGYRIIALEHEGYDWAPFFNEQGIAYAVLKYRLPYGCPEVPVSDAQEALRTIRRHAVEWHVNPYDVGIMGSSAGGHLASTVAVTAPFDARPDFQILFYPVISMEQRWTHSGSARSFLGENSSDEDRHRYSNECHVRRHLTPPAILLLSADDRVVPVMNSIQYFTALSQAEVPAALHVYPDGGHGWGYNASFIHHRQMLADLKEWLAGLDAPDKDAVRVACVGNSITDGYGIPLSETNGYPAVLARKLGKRYKVKNFGVSGYTMLKRGDRPYMLNEVYRLSKEFNPDIVVIKLGTNDSKPQNWIYKEEFMQDAQQMIDEYKALPSHPEIYLAYPVKAMNPSFDISDSIIVNGIIPMLRNLAEKNGLEVIDLHRVFDGHPEWMIHDGIHPNANGAAVIAEEVWKALVGS